MMVNAMNILTRGRRRLFVKNVPRVRFLKGRFYNWTTDFPVHLQQKKPNGESVMILEFELTEDELVEFRRDIKNLKIVYGVKQCKYHIARFVVYLGQNL